MWQTSRGKFNRLQRATAGFTTSAFDGYGLRGPLPARPAPYASYPVLVHRLASLLHAAFRPRLATMSLRFAITSPPSGCEGDLHPKAVKHARHTKARAASTRSPRLISMELALTAVHGFPALVHPDHARDHRRHYGGDGGVDRRVPRLFPIRRQRPLPRSLPGRRLPD